MVGSPTADRPSPTYDSRPRSLAWTQAILGLSSDPDGRPLPVTPPAHTPGVGSDNTLIRNQPGVIGVIGRCSTSGCTRRAARHLEVHTVRAGLIRGVVCERCARATASAAFLLDLIA
jgi:hypothetical protein